ncbi:hypothetical protein [Paenibacillus tianjinensis]|uniref:FHA domain-containing protein n=1 Tax=Paenibacillus tianjinensis TaxID=2810347 RepID=A0ABX7LDF8_9BACL|nr:hypothetical protein [Paenibacillus tianjinensis]QSF46164.1 hypothetical protein JRJ22_06020 [Paenibacillus tianjinensis]
MEYLHFLPVFNAMVWFGILLFVVYGINFYRNYPTAPFVYASRRPSSWHKITLEVLIFVILSSVVVFALHPFDSSLLMSLVLIGIIITYILGSGNRKYRESARLGLMAVHSLLGACFFGLFAMKLMDRLKITLNLNMTDNYDILYFAYHQKRPVVYGFFLLLITLYFVIGKLYMKPVYTSYAEDYQIHPRVNIKLVSGEILPGMYLLQHAGRGDIIAGDHIHRSEAAHIYCINRDQILYIEAAGNVQQGSGL